MEKSRFHSKKEIEQLVNLNNPSYHSMMLPYNNKIF